MHGNWFETVSWRCLSAIIGPLHTSQKGPHPRWLDNTLHRRKLKDYMQIVAHRVGLEVLVAPVVAACLGYSDAIRRSMSLFLVHPL